MTWLLLLGIATARAACETPSHPPAVDAAVRAGQTAYQRLDIVGFEAAHAEVLSAVSCLDAPLEPPTAALVHLHLALDAYLDEKPDEAVVVAYFRSALAAYEKADLPPALAPPGNPLRKLLDAARQAGPGESRPTPAPEKTTLRVDGANSAVTPVDRPFVLQLLGTDEVLWSGVVEAGSATPDWRALGVTLPVEEPAVALPTPPEPARRSRPRVGLLVTGGAALAASGALYGVAYGMSVRYDDPDNPDVTTIADLDALRTRTNTMVWASAGTLGLGVVLGTAAFLDSGPYLETGPGAVRVGWRQRW